MLINLNTGPRMKKQIMVLTVFVSVLALCILSAFEYQQILKHKSDMKVLLKETSDLRTQNQEMRENLKKKQNTPQNDTLPSGNEGGQSPLALEPQSPMIASPKEPNATASKEAGMSPQSLEVIQSTLRQIRKSAGQNDANEIAQLQQENNLLKQEIVRLQSQLNLRQTSETVLSEIQNEKQQTESILASVAGELGSNLNPAQKIKLLESLSELAGNQEPTLLPIIQQGLSDTSPEVRLAAMQLLDDYHSPDAIPLISEALDASDTETRLAAVETFDNIDDPAVSELFLKAMNDKEEDVRTAALGKTDKKSDDIQMAVYEAGIVSSHPDVKTETLSQLEFKGDHKSVDIVIKGLKDSDPEFVQSVNSTLSFLVDKEFQTYEEATRWWAKNKDKYDENLLPVSDQ
jgi:hypothetical protein